MRGGREGLPCAESGLFRAATETGRSHVSCISFIAFSWALPLFCSCRIGLCRACVMGNIFPIWASALVFPFHRFASYPLIVQTEFGFMLFPSVNCYPPPPSPAL